MDRTNRRGFLAAAGAVSLAGCADVSIPFVTDEPPEDDGEREYIFDVEETVTVEKEEYHTWTFESDEITTIAMEMESASEYDVDFYLMSQADLELFENDEDDESFEFSVDNSQTNTNYVSARNRFEAGDYAVVADNTDRGQAVPPVENEELGPAEIEVDIEAWN